MSIQNFLSQVWSARIIRDLERQSVYASVANRNWEADAQNAKMVHIGKMTSDITIKDYTRNADIAAPELVSTDDRILEITQEKYFNFFVDDVDQKQTNPAWISEAMRKSAIAISQEVDTYALRQITKTGTIPTKNIIEVTDAASTVTDGYSEVLLDMREKMQNDRIPKDVVPFLISTPSFDKAVSKWLLNTGGTGSPNIFTPNATDGVVRAGQAGNLLGFDWRQSLAQNEFEASDRTGTILTATSDIILIGLADAYTFADQIANIEAYRPEKRFGDAVKGLYVYDGLMVQPEFMYALKVKR